MVFVGGYVVGLLITDPAQPAIRATDDVDRQISRWRRQMDEAATATHMYWVKSQLITT